MNTNLHKSTRDHSNRLKSPRNGQIDFDKKFMEKKISQKEFVSSKSINNGTRKMVIMGKVATSTLHASLYYIYSFTICYGLWYLRSSLNVSIYVCVHICYKCM